MSSHTYEEFQLKCKEPVDTEKAMAALGRFIKREATLPVPATPQDDDIIISRALSELDELRIKYETCYSLLDEVDTHIRSTTEPTPYIIETMKKFFEYQMSEAPNKFF